MARQKKTESSPDRKGVTIVLPQSLWSRLDEDAARCRRSRNDQIWAILETYYQMNDVEMVDMESTRRAMRLLGSAHDVEREQEQKDKPPKIIRR
jgi:metal-responsive CopG/Arc/MetJ family transcriptional regulator